MTTRFNLKKILADPVERRKLFVRTIQFMQNVENIPTTREEAERAYDEVQRRKAEHV